MAMRTNYIPALLVALALAAPLWAAQHGAPAAGASWTGTRATLPARAASSTGHACAAGVPVPAASRAASFRAPQAHGSTSDAGRARPVPPRTSSPRPLMNSPARQLRMPHQIIRGQGPHNGDWLRNTMRLPPQEQQRRLEQDQHFRQLPQQRQEQLRNRLQTFNSMPPQQQQRVLNRMEMIEHLRPEQQRQATHCSASSAT